MHRIRRGEANPSPPDPGTSPENDPHAKYSGFLQPPASWICLAAGLLVLFLLPPAMALCGGGALTGIPSLLAPYAGLGAD
uniref:Uncharacterized protein n=1 Tax=Arundo donax TaxID=35708 RepID=A0A0A9ERC6_ARUDO